MKLEGALPVPLLTAAVARPRTKGSLGAVTVHGYTPPERPRDDGSTRVNRPIRCMACVAIGLDGRGHNSKNRLCPARSA